MNLSILFLLRFSLIVSQQSLRCQSAPLQESARVDLTSSSGIPAQAQSDHSGVILTAYQSRPYSRRPAANNRPTPLPQLITSIIQQLSRSLGILINQLRCTIVRITMQVARVLRLRNSDNEDYMNLAVCTSLPEWPKQGNSTMAALLGEITNSRLANVSLIDDGSLFLVGDCPECRSPRTKSPTTNTFVVLAGDGALPEQDKSNRRPLDSIVVAETLSGSNNAGVGQVKPIAGSMGELFELVRHDQVRLEEIDQAKQMNDLRWNQIDKSSSRITIEPVVSVVSTID